MVRQVLHVDLDAFFVAVEQALNPELQDKPVVVGGSPGGRGVVASASYEARAYGLRAGMSLSSARRLCPQAIFLEGSFWRYRDASARFMSILADFTPYLEPVGTDEAYLDVTGFEPIYGPARQTARRIKQRISNELGLTASVGIASCKVVAKIASDQSKPDGLLEVAPGEEQLFLAPLPLAKIPCVGTKTEQVLKGMGITTIGELAALPVALVKYTLGKAGEVIHHYANAIDERRVEPPSAAKSISRETTFIEDTLNHRFLEATLRYLSERVGAELRRQGKRARCITLKLRYSDFETITRRCTLKETSDADQLIFDVGLQLMKRALAHSRRPVRLIGIGVSNLVGAERQLNMLDSSAEGLEHLNRSIDRIRSKFGFATIQTGRTLLLREVFPTENGDYMLKTPSFSR